ncbi:sensor histidine kinase [Paenibacillus methanolicus]|uniref:sensor histidine kinase n=1 Tax=Paenibacillus methanolicus TaxID=582686 RepID=UPI001FE8174C|nr:HAMP domain-containing sensor histidine kinase [Paenibacillus methanolicus]
MLLITLATILVSSFLGFFVSNMYYHAKLKPYNDRKLVGIAEQMASFIEVSPETMESYLHNAASLGYEILVVDEQGGERYYGSSFRERDLTTEAKQAVLAGEIYHGVARFPNQPFVSGFSDNASSNTVGVPLAKGTSRHALFVRPDVLLQFGELRSFFAMIGLLAVAFSVLILLASTRYLVGPITRLSEATKRIAQGQYQLKLPTKRRDEIGRLAAHFMTMSRELERVDQARQQFVANVSHEIQSPLTSIQGFAQELAHPDLPPDERERFADIIARESRQLSRLSKQLLLLASLEQGGEAMRREKFNLRAQLRQTAQLLEWQLEEKELALKLAVADDIEIEGDQVLLMQVWTNLIGNAIRHIPAGRSIEVRAEREGGRVAVRVSDTGDGIDAAHLPFLFDRFYRADRARERESGSVGLGLSIAQRIVQLHGGTIEAESSPGQGTTFTVEL